MSKKNTLNPKGVAPNGTGDKYILRLFVTSLSPNSIYAIVNINKICGEYLKCGYELEIIDITLNPEMAVKEQILVVPVLIKKYPSPECRMIGDLSDTAKVLEGLNIYKT